MLFPQIDPVAFHLGPLSVRWYGIAYLAGVIFGWLYARKLTANDKLWGGARNRIGIKDIDNLPSWVMVGIILGGRIGYATFYQPDHFFGDPMGFFRLWDGGMSFHGGMMGAIVAIALFATKQHIVILSLMDIVACAAPIGLYLWTNRQFHQRRVVWSHFQCSLGHCISGWRAIASSPQSNLRGPIGRGIALLNITSADS